MESVEEIYNKYANAVKKYIFCITKDINLAEDIMQETFIVAINQINKFRGDCEISVWLFSIAKKILYKKTKKNNKIKTICIFIIIMLVLFLFFQEMVSRFNFAVDINNLYISYNAEEKIDENTTELQFNVINKKYDLNFEYDTSNGKDIYIMPVGKFTYFTKPSRTIFSFNIDENTEKVFLKDKKGNLKEIWNRDNGILIK